ncbi:hypothetical protein CMUS01_11497 [Colletotrichum musicola]|uniref:Uncharacterized protein n=1 Tax=Colletotrichum musicola TaxID=2175873 RepID=A0A8H6N5E5_9PEZI|nr:hypothetical protein CMUS01_11497 [Colletotrichum musicola]
MEIRGPKIEIRRKPVANAWKPPNNTGTPATVETETTSKPVTFAQAPPAKEHVSLYFSRTFLVGMATISVFMVLCLEILNLFSVRNRGIVAVEEENHYLWTYGPTFILTLFVALWGQLEHRAKHLMPWLAMMNEPAEAEHGILLDYITPLTMGSLVESVRRKHFLVTLTILGSLLLRALVIVSTGLLAVRQQTLVREANVTILDQFNMTRHSVAAQSIDLSTYDTGITVEALVVVFQPNLVDCIGHWWTFPTADIRRNHTITTMTSEKEVALLEQFCMVSVYGMPPRRVLIGENKITRFSNDYKTVYAIKRCKEVEIEGEDPWRIFVSLRGDLFDNTTAFSTLKCHPTYTLTRRMVRYEATPENAGTIVSVSSSVIEELRLRETPANITQNILDAMTKIMQRLGSFRGREDSFYRLMNYTDPQPALHDVRNLTHFMGSWQRTFKMAAVQVAKSIETERTNSTVAGSLSYVRNRLVVEQVALRAMESLLIVLAIISLAFCFFPFASLPTRSGFIITLASILSRSPQLFRALSGTGAMGKATLRTRLSTFRFYLVKDPSSSQVAIALQPKKTSVFQRIRTKESPSCPTNMKWWKPTGSGSVYKHSLIAITMGIVSALEGLLQHSLRNQGLASVSTEDYSRYAWLFLPTITIAIIALAYSTVDVTYRLLHPFQQLQQAKGPNIQAMRYDPLGKLTATAFVRALRARHFALAAAMFTSLLGPMLTIAASGLFTPSLASTEQTAHVEIDSWFNISSGYFNTSLYDRPFDSEITAVPDVALNQAIVFNRLAFPPGTYEGLTFPKMRLVSPTRSGKSKDGDDASLNQTTLVARVPAVRSQMNCSVLVSAENLTCNLTLNPDTFLLAHETFLSQSNGYFALTMNGWYTYPNATTGEEEVSGAYNPFSVCGDVLQHIFTAVGHRTGQLVDHVRIMHCMPYLEVVDVEASFTLPELAHSSDAARRPRIIEEIRMPPLGDLRSDQYETLDVNVDQFHVAVFDGKGGRPIEQLATPDATPEMIERMNWIHSVLLAQGLNEHYRSHAPGPGSPVNDHISAANGSLVDKSPVRLMQSAISTRILEGLLLAMLMCSVVVSCLSGPADILPKNPGSIASRMSLLADSTILRHIADMAEDSSSKQTREEFKETDSGHLD